MADPDRKMVGPVRPRRSTDMPPYVLVSPARNEDAFIEATLRSVVEQTVRPARIVVVSDGSTDGTDAIVSRYAKAYSFIELLRAEPDPVRNFGSKARAVNLGYERVRSLPHEFVGILDADITLPPDYYEQVMTRFAENPGLGLAGGVLADKIGRRFVVKATSVRWSVNGPIQMFRRVCWEAIGGYRCVRYGGVDTVAEVMCRMQGWNVRAFPDLRAHHHRQTGTATHGALRAAYKAGIESYKNGFHPLFMVGRCIRHLVSTPVLAGALAMAVGYSVPALRAEEWQVDDEFVRFLRREQLRRIVTRDWL